MKSVNILVFLVAIIVSLQQGGSAYEIVGNLSSLQNQFQSLLTEFERENTFDASIATLLEKIDLLQYSSSSHPNLTIDWFTPPKDIPFHPPLRIVVVVSSFEGMYLNSGIGTFYSSLSDFLVQRGHSVTILYTDNAASDTPAFTKWKAQAEKRGLAVVRLGAYPVDLRLSHLAQHSYQVYEYLKAHQAEFDVVHFPDWEGPGYYSMLAKNDGIAFLSKTFIVGLHGPWRWVKAANNPDSTTSARLSTADDMETDWMEKRSVEMADLVWSPSSDIVTWLSRNGWAIPTSVTYKMPYLPGREVSQLNVKNNGELHDNINEIVFFGRLETRKGLKLFADALDRLAFTRPEFAGTKVTFLGRSANIDDQTATAYLDQRFVKGAWPFKILYVSHKDRKAALEYLSEPTRIAVIPSLVDNTPYTVYECLFANIPFIASDIPSIASLIAESDRNDALFEVNAISLAAKLEDKLDNGARVVKSALQLRDVEATWKAFYAKAFDMTTAKKEALKTQQVALDQPSPLVSVCITHFNRPQYLQLALESVEAQTYGNYEVVLVDDGSTMQEAKDYLATLGPKFISKGWQLVLSNNQYLGAARNKAAQQARGEYLVFLDDDNIMTPQLLRTYVDVALHTRAEILTAAHDVFQGDGRLEDGTVVGRWVPTGASASLGIFKNCFGDANFFIKKSVFVAQKGFTEDRGVGQEDHEFLAKAVLDGRSLAVIPEPLLAYRMHNRSEQMLYTTDSLKNALRAHRPYRSLMEESGIEINEKGMATSSPTKSPESLKLLAYSRVNSRQAVQTCNMTITKVSPTTIGSRKTATLTFITSVRDCDLKAVRIGDTYVCSITSVTASQFTCTTQIPINGNYPIYAQLGSQSYFNDTKTRITVTPTPTQNGESTVLTTMAVYREAGLFDFSELISLLAKAIASNSSKFAILSDTVTTAIAKRDQTFVDELHTMMLSITSGNPTASNLYALLYSQLVNNPTCIKPYRFYTLTLNAGCSTTGECSCSPGFSGVGCTTPVGCPNSCSGHGSCVAGFYSMICKCNQGWTGSDCSLGLCKDTCYVHGTCKVTAGGGNGTCVCSDGWKGVNCDVSNCTNGCNGNPCDTSGKCICPSGDNTVDCSGSDSSESGDHIKQNDVSSNGSNRDRTIFIGVTVGFILLAALALIVLFAVRRSKNAAEGDF